MINLYKYTSIWWLTCFCKYILIVFLTFNVVFHTLIRIINCSAAWASSEEKSLKETRVLFVVHKKAILRDLTIMLTNKNSNIPQSDLTFHIILARPLSLIMLLLIITENVAQAQLQGCAPQHTNSASFCCFKTPALFAAFPASREQRDWMWSMSEAASDWSMGITWPG